MALLSANVADQVRALFTDNLQEPVTIELFTRKRSLLTIPGQTECPYCEETEQLLNEVAGLSPKLSLTVHDLRTEPQAGADEGVTADLVPTIVLHGQGRGKVRFMGIPAGNEFSTLIQDIVDLSKGTTSLSTATREDLENLTGDVHIRVFVTPT